MQLFNKGDLVRVAKDLGPSMSHFTADCDAIVLYSYTDAFGRSTHSEPQYALYLSGKGHSSWYHEHQLTLIKAAQHELLATWEAESKTRDAQEGDLDWIFANGPATLTACPGPSVAALAQCFTERSLWGSRGEGMDYYENALTVLSAAKPFLENHDKAGWLAHCARVKEHAG